MNRPRHDFAVSNADGEASRNGAIAIVGASCRLPGAPDLDSFWQLLIEGRDAVTEIPDDRWNKAQLLHPEKGHRGKAYTFAAGTLGDVSGFDPAFFGISPREATQMDPQQRLLLELAYEAIEDAGMDMAALAGRNIGVFVGGSSWDYLNLNVADVSTTDPYSMIGVTLSILANRISYVFDLHGPSFTVDTACSSSLVALHQACEAIRAGQIEAAMVGGVSLLLAPQSFVGFCAASMLSPKGRCHAFGAEADGYVRSEGGGIVILKPLADAIAAGDPIRAVIRGTGVNSDGRTTGLSLPNRDAQAALLEQVYGRFGIDPAQLSYVEAHGTGTLVGDPIEAGALGIVLGKKRTSPLPIGSVKSNIGHLEAGSGMAGLLKAMLVAEHGTIPPSLHSDTPNPNIAFDDLNLRLAHAVEALPGDVRRTVGVNSFGFGGTNAHAVLESADLTPTIAMRDGETLPPLLLSARSDDALTQLATIWRDRIAETGTDRPALHALLRGAALNRSQHGRRLVALGTDGSELIDALTAHIEGRAHSRLIANSAVSGKVAFVFSGNGSQWAGMATDALAGSAAFRAALKTVDAALRPHLGWSAIEALEAADADRLRNTDVAQPLLFAVQVGLTIALRDYGVEAEAVMGHSVGEVAAAWASGALDLDAAARVIAARSRAQQARHGVGAMAVMGFGADEARKALAEAGLDRIGVEIAAHNSSSAITVAGPVEAIDRLAEESKERGWRFTRLDLDYAFHSAAMDPIEAEIRADLSDLAAARSDVPFVSTVEGRIVDGACLDGRYWWRNVRAPVFFVEAAQVMVADGVRIFIEVGPHPVVQAYLNDALRIADREGRVVPTLSRRPIKNDPIAAIAARVHAAGGDIRNSAVFISSSGKADLRSLPCYPWQRERFWVPRTTESTDPATVPFDHPLLGQRVGPQPLEWVRHLGIEQMPWLADHMAGGAAVMPAAAMLDLALAAAGQRKPGAVALELLDVEIGRALVLEPQVMREMRLRVAATTGEFELTSRPRLTDDPWTVHMSGRMVESDSLAPSGTARAIPASASACLPAAALYALASRLGLDYGPAFRVIDHIEIAGEDRATVRFGDAADLGPGYLIAPNLLDGALQGLLALAADRLGEDMGVLPWRFGRVRLLNPDGAVPMAARLAVTRVGPRSVRADVALVDAGGATIAELSDCWFVRVAMGRNARDEEQYFHPVLVASGLPGGEAATGELTVAEVIGPVRELAVEEGRLLADAFASAIAAETLRGLMAAGAARLQPQDLFRTGRVSPMSRPQFDQLLRWLAADGLAEQAGDGSWNFTTQDLPPSEAILRTLLYDAPVAVADIALLALAGDTLPALLRDGPGAGPQLPAALWDQFLGQSPSGEAATEALVAAVARAAAGRRHDRPFRILEVGARRGRLSRALLRHLEDPDVRLVAATMPDDLPAMGEALAGDPRAGAVAWAPGEANGMASFDLIVGLHALSLSDNGGANVAGLASMLAPGGMVLLAEPSVNRVWQLLRPFLAPPSDATRWTGLLTRTGFEDLQTRPVAGGLWPIDLIAGQLASAETDRAGAKRAVSILSASGDALADRVARLVGGTAKRGGLDGIEAAALDPIAIVLGASSALTLADRLAMIARLAALPIDTQYDVTLIVPGALHGDPATAALMGARRVLANEAAHVRLRLIAIDPELADSEAAERAAQELLTPDDEDEIGWSPAGRVVTRVRTGLPAARDRQPGALRLAIQRPGLLDSLGWQEADSAARPAANEVAIDVKAAGLNFRDVMWSMGLLPDEALLDGFAGPTLGLECAGIVTAIGEGVTAFEPGDRVMAFAPASLSTRTVTAGHAVMRMPAGLDFASAATVPVAFLTVAYALGHLARISAGETLLVHGGAGGVGLAAIQYALHRGARVFATAGSPAKRALLANLGVEAVLDSRSLSFADDVLRLTNGEGVDAVLNSLSGEAMRRSLSLVKPFGRFLELGKRDFYENSSIGLRPFRHNVSYFGIDADQLPLKQPKLAAQLFGEIADLFAEGALRPLPHRTYDYADAESAFRLMQSAGHIGKIVLAAGPVLPRSIAAPAPYVAGPGAYVVTGGLDGFGREAARWLARNGARKIALLSRRGPSADGADALVAEFAALGVDAKAYAVDVSNETALAATLETIRSDLAPIAGVIHAAVAMDDALLGSLDAARFARALAPKLKGAEALDRQTRRDPVDLFLLFSSVTTPLGNPGQGNYVAANAGIEALAERRHAEGLPALAIQWGPIGDAGYLSRETQVSEILTKQLGGAHLTAQDALDRVPALLASGMPVAGVAAVRWSAMKNRLPLIASPLFSEMAMSAADEAGDVDLAALLADLSPKAARERVTGLLIEEVARIMKLAPERVEAQRPLAELGMDSLMAVELRLAVEQRFGLSIPLLALSEGATLAAMAGRIIRGLSSEGDSAGTDEKAKMLERLALHEGAGNGIPAPETVGDAEPGMAAVAAVAP